MELDESSERIHPFTSAFLQRDCPLHISFRDVTPSGSSSSEEFSIGTPDVWNAWKKSSFNLALSAMLQGLSAAEKKSDPIRTGRTFAPGDMTMWFLSYISRPETRKGEDIFQTRDHHVGYCFSPVILRSVGGSEGLMFALFAPSEISSVMYSPEDAQPRLEDVFCVGATPRALNMIEESGDTREIRHFPAWLWLVLLWLTWSEQSNRPLDEISFEERVIIPLKSSLLVNRCQDTWSQEIDEFFLRFQDLVRDAQGNRDRILSNWVTMKKYLDEYQKIQQEMERDSRSNKRVMRFLSDARVLLEIMPALVSFFQEEYQMEVQLFPQETFSSFSGSGLVSGNKEPPEVDGFESSYFVPPIREWPSSSSDLLSDQYNVLTWWHWEKQE